VWIVPCILPSTDCSIQNLLNVLYNKELNESITHRILERICGTMSVYVQCQFNSPRKYEDSMIIVKSIVYKPKGMPGEHPANQDAGYLRQPLQEANLIEGYGIEADRKGGNPNRNLNVMDETTQAELAAQGFPTGPGVLGENFILGGIDLRTLAEGTQLRLGNEAVIALLKLREPCHQLTPLDERMPES